MANTSKPDLPHDYEKRVMSQTLSWAIGKPYHDTVTDECCPDFSCCVPSLFTRDDSRRWRVYRETKERLRDAALRNGEGRDDG